MKALLILFLLQHAVISARSGMVTYTEGRVNVAASEHVGEGNSLTTGPGARVELLLNPDAHLRMRGNSAIVLESEALDRIVVRLERGQALIDARRIERNMPIRVRLADVELAITRNGRYLIDEQRVVVLDGEVVAEATRRVNARKGWALVLAEGEPQSLRLENLDEIEADPLVRWSERRAQQLEPPRQPRRLSPFGERGLRFPFP